MSSPALRAAIAKTVAASIAAAVIAACSSGNDDPAGITQPDPTPSLTSCATRTDVFRVSPMAFDYVLGWLPLGSLSPPLHTFPTPHQTLVHSIAGGTLHTVPVVSPGDIVLIGASRRIYQTDGRSDFTLQFAVCREVTGYFNHFASLDTSISARLSPFDQSCVTSTIPPAYSDCTTRVLAIPVAAGAPLGITGGVPGMLAWDFGLRDSRSEPIPYANPSRWGGGGLNGDLVHVVAASDYFAEPVRSRIRERLGRGDGSELRTTPPLGGTLDVDVPGTAQGVWFNTARIGGTEGPHFAIVPDNIDPTEFAVSGSESLPGYPPSVGFWRPVETGMVDPAPRTIVADGQIRCVNLYNGRSLLLLLTDATTLRAEARPIGVNCAAAQPWAFTAAAFDFHR